MTLNGATDHHGSGRSLDTERRLTVLEQAQTQLYRRIDMLERDGDEQLDRERERDRVLAQTVTRIQRLMKDVEGLTANQQRFLIGFVACFGGLVISIVRTKIGL